MRFELSIAVSALLPAVAPAFVPLSVDPAYSLTRLHVGDGRYEDVVAAFQKTKLIADVALNGGGASNDALPKADPIIKLVNNPASLTDVPAAKIASNTPSSFDPVVAVIDKVPNAKVVAQSLPDISRASDMSLTVTGLQIDKVDTSALVDSIKDSAPMIESVKATAVSAKDVVAANAPAVLDTVKDVVEKNGPAVLDTVKTTATITKDVVAANAPSVIDSVKNNAPSIIDKLTSAAKLTKDAVVANAPGVIESVKSTSKSAKEAVKTAQDSGAFDSSSKLIEFAKKGVESAGVDPEDLNRVAKDTIVTAAEIAKKGVETATSQQTLEQVMTVKKDVTTFVKPTVEASLKTLGQVAPPLINAAKNTLKGGLAQVIQAAKVIEAQETKVVSDDAINFKFVAAKSIAFIATFGTAVLDFDYGGLIEKLDIPHNGMLYLFLSFLLWGYIQREEGRKRAEMEFQEKYILEEEPNIFETLTFGIFKDKSENRF